MRPSYLRCDPTRLLERLLRVVCDAGLDLHRDEAVDAAARVERRPEHVTRVANVVQREGEEDLGRIVDRPDQLLQLRVVGVPFGERLLEDRRIRGDAGDGVLIHHPREAPGVDESTRQRVEPHGLAALGQLMQV